MHSSLVGDLFYYCGSENMADTEKEDQGSPMKYPKPLPSLLMPQRPCVLEYVRGQIYVSVI